LDKLSVSPKFDETKTISEALDCCNMMIGTITDTHDQAAMRLVVKCLYSSMAVAINKLIDDKARELCDLERSNS